MREELENKLMKDMPFLEAINVFSGEKLGFPIYCDCDDGWFNLIYNCFKEIQELYNKSNISISNLIVYQIKEKYGGLRIYLGSYIDGVQEIVNKYEKLSYEICEICGEKGKTRGKVWFKTLCEKHRIELNYE